MLCKAIAEDPFFDGKEILLLDKDAKKANDRTWCFWEKNTGEFDSLLSHSWNHITFKGAGFTRDFSLAPYSYKMVEGESFYAAYLKALENMGHVTFRREEVKSVHDRGNQVEVTTTSTTYMAPRVFSSLVNVHALNTQNTYPVLKQHFKGWFIKAASPVFDPGKAIFMDFSIPQNGLTRFMYVLPGSETEALVEYTLFSPDYLPENEYDEALKTYLNQLLPNGGYEVRRTEKGSIPMTAYDFTRENSENLLYIGTAGGWTKPSTGYTFKNTHEQVGRLLSYLKTGKPLHRFPKRNRHWYYDLLLLDILHRRNHLGSTIFESLFKKRRPRLIFKFLDEKSTLWEDLKVIWACPKWPFLRAALKRIF